MKTFEETIFGLNFVSSPTFPIAFDNEGDGAGDGADGAGGVGGDQQPTVENLQKQLNALLSTNTNLKNEKKQLKERVDSLSKISESFDQLGGDDGIKRLTEYQRKIQTDEMSALLADGKVEEWFEKRTDGLRKTHSNEVSKKDEYSKKLEDRAIGAERNLEKLQIDINVRESARQLEGFEQSAIPDAILLASNVFTFDPEVGKPVMKDEDGGVVYGNDAKTPKTIMEWLAELQDERPHWWGGTKGVNGKGGRGSKGSELSLEQQLEKGMLNMDQYRAIRKEKGFKNFG